MPDCVLMGLNVYIIFGQFKGKYNYKLMNATPRCERYIPFPFSNNSIMSSNQSNFLWIQKSCLLDEDLVHIGIMTLSPSVYCQVESPGADKSVFYDTGA